MLSPLSRCFVFFLLTLSISLATFGNVRTTPAKGSISGIVVAAGLTNAAGVRITLHGADSATASQTTGGDGRFVFYDILPGTYSVEVDPATLPQKYRATPQETIEVKPGTRYEAAITLEPRRSVVGRAYLDVNADGVYSPGQDTIVAGAQISVDGRFTISGPDGTFRFDELPAGRMSLVVYWPGNDHTTHVVLDLGAGPVTDRVINVPLFR